MMTVVILEEKVLAVVVMTMLNIIVMSLVAVIVRVITGVLTVSIVVI